jgi:hypothetical protein
MKNLQLTIVLALLSANQCLAENSEELLPISLDQDYQKVVMDQRNRPLGTHKEVVEGREIEVLRVLTTNGHIKHYQISAETVDPTPPLQNQ